MKNGKYERGDSRRLRELGLKFPRRRMVPVDLIKFMVKNKLMVEGLARELEYTTPGMVIMIARGTVKPAVLDALRKKYPDVDKYVHEVKS